MDCLIIEGKQRLSGSITVGGAKNAALPILFASVLTSQKCVFENVPDLLDISTTVKLLAQMGVKVSHEPANHFVEIEAKTLSSFEAPYDLVRTMRASILILGPTLARYKKARVSLPGGCSIGARPVNLHLTGLEKMGAVISIEGGYINAETTNGKRLKGAEIFFEQVSVGATENLMMAAALADGRTILRNAAREPEIVDLADVLIKMGAKISGAGTTEITIDGVEQLGGVKHSIISDRIEAGTYLMAAAITGGDVNLPNVSPLLLQAVLDKLTECGLEVSSAKNSIRLNASRKSFQAKDIMTLPFPGFPTDMQAQYMALMTVAEGTSIITENIFENRFMHVSELSRLGADIKVQGNVAIVKGLNGKLSGAAVMATDLRASACLVLAGLAAEGKTKVRRIYHLDRGYEKMEVKLAAIGAKISREKEDA